MQSLLKILIFLINYEYFESTKSIIIFISENKILEYLPILLDVLKNRKKENNINIKAFSESLKNNKVDNLFPYQSLSAVGDFEAFIFGNEFIYSSQERFPFY